MEPIDELFQHDFIIHSFMFLVFEPPLTGSIIVESDHTLNHDVQFLQVVEEI